MCYSVKLLFNLLSSEYILRTVRILAVCNYCHLLVERRAIFTWQFQSLSSLSSGMNWVVLYYIHFCVHGIIVQRKPGAVSEIVCG